MEALLKKLIETTEQSKSDSGSIVKEVAEGLGIASLMSLLKDIALKLGSFVLKNPLAVAAGAGLATGATGGSLTGSVLTGGAAGLARGGIPGAVAGAATGAAGWAAGRIMTKDSDSRIGRWDDAGEPGSKIPKSKENLNFKGSGVAKYLQETDASTLQKSMGISKEQYDVFRGSIAKIESPSYSKKGGSSGKFSGAYQMGADEIRDSAKALGMSAPTREEFLNNPQLQEKLFDKYTESHHKQLLKNEKYASMSKEEQLKVLGYAHNQGAGGASKWLKTGVADKDAFGTAGTKYYESVGKNLSALEKGELKINYSDKQNPVKIAQTTSKDTANSIKPGYSQVKEELQERKSHKGVDVENLDAEYSSSVLNFMKDFEKETGKKVNITSGYRPPTDKEKSELGSVAKTQHDVKKEAGKMAASEYGSMHGMGAAGDLTIEGYSASDKAKNSMNNMPAEYKKVWKDLAEKHNLTIPLADNAKQNEWWHIEKSGEKRGGASKAGLEGEEYTNYIKSKSLQSAIEGKEIGRAHV